VDIIARSFPVRFRMGTPEITKEDGTKEYSPYRIPVWFMLMPNGNLVVIPFEKNFWFGLN